MDQQIWIRAIRGAISVEANTKEAISNATVVLLCKILEENNLTKENVESAIFTLTHDLNADFPARSARVQLGWDEVSMICTQEIPVPDSLKMCLRVMLGVYTNLAKNEVRHVYLGGAAKLRPDLNV